MSPEPAAPVAPSPSWWPKPKQVMFTVYGEPAPGGSKTAGVRKDGKVFVRESSQRAQPWKVNVAREAAMAMQEARLEPFNGQVVLLVEFNLARPKGHYGANGLLRSAPLAHTKRPDATKLIRPLEDAMRGIVWRDDSQVVVQMAIKRYADDGPACARVTVFAMEDDVACLAQIGFAPAVHPSDAPRPEAG